jgi:hypothetical protein
LLEVKIVELPIDLFQVFKVLVPFKTMSRVLLGETIIEIGNVQLVSDLRFDRRANFPVQNVLEVHSFEEWVLSNFCSVTLRAYSFLRVLLEKLEGVREAGNNKWA